MAKLTLPNFSSLTNETAFLNQLNLAMTQIEASIELTLSRNGQTPNEMTASLDMNSQRIINAAAPIDANDYVRLIDVQDGIKGDKGDKGDPGSAVLSDALAAIETAEGIQDPTNKFFGWSSPTAGAFLPIETVGISFLAQASKALQRTYLELGDSATKNVGTAAGTVSAGDDSRFSLLTVSNFTANMTIAATDQLLRHNSGSAHEIVIPPNSSVPISVGKVIIIRNPPAAGVITLKRGSGVGLTVNNSAVVSDCTIPAATACTLIQDIADGWFVTGPGIS